MSVHYSACGSFIKPVYLLRKKCPATKGAPNQWHMSLFIGSVHNGYTAKNAFASHCGLTAHQPSHFSFTSTPRDLPLKCANYGYRYPSPTQRSCAVFRGMGQANAPCKGHRDVDNYMAVTYKQGDDGQTMSGVEKSSQNP